MPGPGGGSRGGFGGGARGGGFGGGHRGGGFGGGPRGPRHYHRGFYGGYWGPRRYGYGGGCLGGMLGLMMAPIILLLMSVVILFSIFGSAFNTISTGGEIYYDEERFEDYANERYFEQFGKSEDCILVVFVTHEDNYHYECMIYKGFHFESRVNALLEGNNSGIEEGFYDANPQSTYKYTMGAWIVTGIDALTENITAIPTDSYFSSYCTDENHNPAASRLINDTELSIDTAYVNAALEKFTQQTGISMVIVVDEGEDVFGKTITGEDIFMIVIAVAMIVIAIVIIVNVLKRRNKNQDDGSYKGSNNNNYNNNNYNSNDNYYNGF
ncbi:MAG: hypothetical protein IJD74_04870 [Clostridia bacterium]|nr:hypothetical protein [Clostridia bacterium]